MLHLLSVIATNLVSLGTSLLIYGKFQNELLLRNFADKIALSPFTAEFPVDHHITLPTCTNKLPSNHTSPYFAVDYIS